MHIQVFAYLNVYPACHVCSFGNKASSKEHKYKYGRKYDAPSGQGGDIPDSFVSEWLGIHLDATSQSLTLAIFTLNLSATAQEYITLAGTLLEASSVQCDSTLRHMIQIERVHREGSNTAIPSIKPRAFNWNVPWKAPRVSDEGMRWLRSPQYGLSQHYFSCMKTLNGS